MDENRRVTVRNPDETVWCLIRISDVAAVLDLYQLWKDEPWYHAVDWALVSDQLDASLTVRGAAPTIAEMWEPLRDVAAAMRRVDREGLNSLLMEPITVSPVQLTNGGHRLNAMRLQGVGTVPGMFHYGDLGRSMRHEQAYPNGPQESHGADARDARTSKQTHIGPLSAPVSFRGELVRRDLRRWRDCEPACGLK